MRPPFEPNGWQLEFRNELRAAVRALEIPEDHLLVAEYTSAIRQPGVDAENVLLCNLGLGSAGGCAIRFLWTVDEPPPAPSGMQHGHKLCYRIVPDERRLLGEPTAVVCGSLANQNGELKPLDVWLAHKHGTLKRFCENEQLGPFALRVTLETSRPRAAAGVLKPLFDGTISALQHDPDPASAEAGAQLLAKRSSGHASWLSAALSAPGPLGSSHPLVGRRIAAGWSGIRVTTTACSAARSGARRFGWRRPHDRTRRACGTGERSGLRAGQHALYGTRVLVLGLASEAQGEDPDPDGCGAARARDRRPRDRGSAQADDGAGSARWARTHACGVHGLVDRGVECGRARCASVVRHKFIDST